MYSGAVPSTRLAAEDVFGTPFHSLLPRRCCRRRRRQTRLPTKDGFKLAGELPSPFSHSPDVVPLLRPRVLEGAGINCRAERPE